MQLNQVLPNFDFSEVHSTWVPVIPNAADRAFRNLTNSEVFLLKPLLWLRTLPSRITGHNYPTVEPGQTLLKDFCTYVDIPGQEYVLGEICRPWQILGDLNLQHIAATEDFVAFQEPNFVKITISYHYEGKAGGTRVTTETRVAGTCRDATNRFRFYWWGIRIPSGMIRRSMLAALRRRIARNSGTAS